jgi:hypothetical protein rflaF_08742
VKLSKGSVVIADAGRDCGGFFAVTEISGKYCLIADGKSRRLSSPKRKSIKHIRKTNSMIDLNDITDKKLRKLLSGIKAAE